MSTGEARLSPLALDIRASAPARRTIGRMKSREEQLTWAKQRALICVDMGRFSDAVAGLRADLDKSAMSSDQARLGYKAAADAALGRFASADRVDRRPQITLCSGPQPSPGASASSRARARAPSLGLTSWVRFIRHPPQ